MFTFGCSMNLSFLKTKLVTTKFYYLGTMASAVIQAIESGINEGLDIAEGYPPND
jgi:hypothetical protein